MKKNPETWKIFTCPICNKVFEAKLDPRRTNATRLCSKDCRLEWLKRNQIKKQCIICNKEYFVKQSDNSKSLFCSTKCRGVFQKDHPNKNNRIKKGNTGKLSPAYKHGKSSEIKLLRAGDDNKKWRLAVLKRDLYACQRCFKKGYLEVHHKKSFTNHPELRFNIDNGITLCPSCHSKEDTHRHLPPDGQFGRIKLICKICGKEFKVNHSDVKKGRRFCSKKCSNVYKTLQPNSKLKFACKICGKEFLTFPSNAKQRANLYCSWKCKTEGRSKPFKCQTCGKEFRVYKSDKRKFCSAQCMGISNKVDRKKICPTCGEEFNYKDNGQKFCSLRCSKLKPKLYKNCEVCGKIFLPKRKEVKTCSKICQNKFLGKIRTGRPRNYDMSEERNPNWKSGKYAL